MEPFPDSPLLAPVPEVELAADTPALNPEQRKLLELEQRLRHAQKMEAIGTLAGGIAHDFNNILGAIICNAELAVEDISVGRGPADCVGEILKASRRAADLVRQILAFSSREEQPMRATQVEFPVREALSLLRSSLPAGIALTSTFEPGCPPVLGDATQIHQVIMNLCTNAWHAIGERGLIEVCQDTVSVDEHGVEGNPSFRVGRYVHVTVRDSGRGMSPEVLQKIFEPFFTTKQRGQGTGLGLGLVQSIMEKHGGAVTVSSRLGFGTIFHVYFPALESNAPAPAPAAPVLPTGRGQKVLFVDDETMLCNVARRLLAALNYVPTTETDPRRALALVSAHPEAFDAVITDLSMPHLSGLELAESLLQVRPGLPVILSTGYAGDITLESIRAVGLRDLLQKPVTSHSIAFALRRLFEQIH